MKKYVLVETNQEVKLGDTIAYKIVKETSFGTIKIYKEYTLTSANINTFIKNGIIKEASPNKESKNTIGFFVNIIAKKLGKTVDELVPILESLNTVCPKAVLDLFLQTIAVYLYEENPQAFDETDVYYSLRPKDGTVGKVNYVLPFIPLFKSVEDAELARTILKDQLKLMYGKQQKDC